MNSKLFCGSVKITCVHTKSYIHEHSAVKIYKIHLPSNYTNISILKKHLTIAELKRSERYHFQQDRDRFIICRAFLKLLLSDHLDLDSNKIVIATDENKKPFLPSHPKVFFNVSHTLEYGLIAISQYPVGIDVEYIDRKMNHLETASLLFKTNDLNILDSSNDKIRLFFTYWTRKESIVKATGRGIDDNLINIPVRDGKHLINANLIKNGTALSVYSFEVDDHHIGSIAMKFTEEAVQQLFFLPLPSVSN